MSESEPEYKKCTRCGAYKLPDAFGIRQKDSVTGGKKGELTSKCAACMDDDRRYKRSKNKNKRKESMQEEDLDLAAWTQNEYDGEAEGEEKVKTVTIEEFLARLGSCVRSNAASSEESDPERKAGVFKFAERVDCRSIQASSHGKDTSELRGRADELARLVGRETKWRWTYENTRPRVRRGDTVFSYSCAQSDAREAAPKLPRLGRKSRNRKRMERFPCNGWLFVAVAMGDPVVVVRIGHEVGHCGHRDADGDGERDQVEFEDEDEDETAVPTA